MGELQLAAKSFAAAAAASAAAAAASAAAAAANNGDGCAAGILTAEEVEELKSDAQVSAHCVTCDV
jgi:ribosomal protein L12E/L44/L45/RPP1/RPP2